MPGQNLMAGRWAYHLASPPGRGGITLFELYGDCATRVMADRFRGRSLPAENESRLGNFIDSRGEVVDEIILSRVPAAGSWCGLETWTLAAHGGVYIQERFAEILSAAGGDSWSQRHVLAHSVRSGALDAPRAAAYEFLIEARTERAAGFLLRQYEGEFSFEIKALIARIEQGDGEELRRGLRRLRAGERAARRLVSPLRVLIAGRPNAGKSTLLNRLAATERAIVSSSVGTTRDLVRQTISLRGYPVEFIDSAGIHAAPRDEVEEAAISRARDAEADALLYLLGPPWKIGAEERLLIDRFDPDRVLRVHNFADLEESKNCAEKNSAEKNCAEEINISALTGEGMEGLESTVVARWLGPESGLLAAAPFTAAQSAALREIDRRLDGKLDEKLDAIALDEARDTLISCLRSSWPEEGPGRVPA